MLFLYYIVYIPGNSLYSKVVPLWKTLYPGMLLFIHACSYPLKAGGQWKELDFYQFIESLKSAKKNSCTLTTKTHGKCLNFHANECLTSDFALQLSVECFF